MCGIAGIISSDKKEAIKKMAQTLIHRGPDEEGYYHDGVISLGQRRLSIIDISGAGSQSRTKMEPCSFFVTEKYTIVLN